MNCLLFELFVIFQDSVSVCIVNLTKFHQKIDQSHISSTEGLYLFKHTFEQ